MSLYATVYLDLTLPKILPTPVDDKIFEMMDEREDGTDRVWSMHEGKTYRRLSIKEEVRSSEITTELKDRLDWLVKFVDYGIGGTNILGFLFDERDRATDHVLGIMGSETQSLTGVEFKKLVGEDSNVREC